MLARATRSQVSGWSAGGCALLAHWCGLVEGEARLHLQIVLPAATAQPENDHDGDDQPADDQRDGPTVRVWRQRDDRLIAEPDQPDGADDRHDDVQEDVELIPVFRAVQPEHRVVRDYPDRDRAEDEQEAE